MLPVPRWPSGLTPEWATEALRASFEDAVVSRVEVRDEAHGTNRRVRLRLSYSEGGGPASIFVKLPGSPLHRLALLALRAWAAEARLASSELELPAEHARFLAAGYEPRTLSAVVVMEDVTERGGQPNQATRALSVLQVASGLEELARLHGAFWNRDLRNSSFLRPWHLSPAWAPVSYASLRHGLRRLDRLPAGQRISKAPDASVLERQFRRSAVLASTGPQTLLHGDPHPGNTYSLPGERSGFYDWQLVRTGNWSHDIGYFLIGALSVADRRGHERELLRGYLGRLREAGGVAKSAPLPEEAWQRYRAAPAFGLATWLHTLSAGSLQPEAVAIETISRFAAAYDDLGTRDLL